MTTALDRMLARRGKTRQDVDARTLTGRVLQRSGVQASSELTRVAEMRRRRWTDEGDRELALRLTKVLGRPGSDMVLRPVQARCLADAANAEGLLAAVRVGAGKTLVTFLLPAAMGVSGKHALLLVPARLRDKTLRDFRELRRHWDAEPPAVESYEMLSRHPELLEERAPALLIADECHRLKNLRVACTRRVRRYLEGSGVKFCALSGTVANRSLHDWGHLACWALDSLSPAPRSWPVLHEWSRAVDAVVDDRLAPGELSRLASDEDREGAATETEVARRALRRRFSESLGVVATAEHDLGCSLSVGAVDLAVGEGGAADDAVVAAFARLRALWETPDGQPISDAASLWRHALELQLGFYYRWDPRPPEEWLDARREWARVVRDATSSIRSGMDTEMQVAQRAARGELREEQCQAYLAWAAVRKTFEPRTVAEWLTLAPLDRAARLLYDGHLVWTGHVAFGEKLGLVAGVPYFGEMGVDVFGDSIEAWAGRACVASIQACSLGRNLQAWSRATVLAPPANGAAWEQLLGRLHRDGQEADEVSFDVHVGCVEAWACLAKAREEARFVEETTGSPQKILRSDWTVPSEEEVARRAGPRWRK